MLVESARRILSSTERQVVYFVLAAAVMAVLLASLSPRWLRYPDAMEYADMARGLARGEGLQDRAIWIYQLSFSEEVPAAAVRRAVLFPVIESLFFRVLGATDAAARACSAFFYFLSVVTLFRLARNLAAPPAREDWRKELDLLPVAQPAFRSRTDWIALAAGGLALFDAQSLIFSASGLSEPLFTFVLLLIAFQLVREPFWGQWFQVGILVGLSQWIRLNGFTLIVPCLMGLWILDRGAFKRNAAQMILGLALPLLFLALRNRQAIGMFSFVGVNGAIMFNGIAGLTEHGIERRLYLPPEFPPTLGPFLRDHWAAFLAKAWSGTDRNSLMAMTSVSPLAWGAVALHTATRWSRMTPRLRALHGFAISAALLWVGLFSIGEFEGQRFFVPLAPLVLLLAVLAFREFAEAFNTPPRLVRRAAPMLFAAVALPGVYQLTQLIEPSGKPDFFRSALRETLERETPKEAVVLSDVPWAVAWYGDRTSVWIPARVDETAAIARRSSATHLLLTPGIFSDGEIEEKWRQVFQSRQGRPNGWTPLSTEPASGSLALFKLGN